jgi:hypothetical protein
VLHALTAFVKAVVSSVVPSPVAPYVRTLIAGVSFWPPTLNAPSASTLARSTPPVWREILPLRSTSVSAPMVVEPVLLTPPVAPVRPVQLTQLMAGADCHALAPAPVPTSTAPADGVEAPAPSLPWVAMMADDYAL